MFAFHAACMCHQEQRDPTQLHADTYVQSVFLSPGFLDTYLYSNDRIYRASLFFCGLFVSYASTMCVSCTKESNESHTLMCGNTITANPLETSVTFRKTIQNSAIHDLYFIMSFIFVLCVRLFFSVLNYIVML